MIDFVSENSDKKLNSNSWITLNAKVHLKRNKYWLISPSVRQPTNKPTRQGFVNFVSQPLKSILRDNLSIILFIWIKNNQAVFLSHEYTEPNNDFLSPFNTLMKSRKCVVVSPPGRGFEPEVKELICWSKKHDLL